MLATVSFALLLASLRVLASPIVVRDSPITLPVARRVNATGAANLVKMEQARARALSNRSTAAKFHTNELPSYSIPATNQFVEYVVTVGVGSPPTDYLLVVDTGSSNTWIGNGKKYIKTATAIDTKQSLDVEYGSGIMLGEEWLDEVHLTPGITLTNQSIGAALIAIGFDGVNGVLGIGPQALTYNTLFPNSTSTITTVTGNAFLQGFIDQNMVGISFEPTNTNESVTNGQLTFGGVDATKYTGELTYVPVTTTQPAGAYFGINQTISYGSESVPILPSLAGIVDTGTTLFLLPTDVIAKYQQVTGAQMDQNVGLLSLTPDQFANLESLFVNIGGQTFEFTPTAQAFPRSLNAAFGGSDDLVYLVVADIGYESGSGLDFINGMTFLERFYTVYDAGTHRFGIATTASTYATN
ncbi:hypothetical protein NLI96_g1724 [Meripilus lineatus]|uniref:Peptidase A1 domain-containing protein n=1 Tax=Meripilus lineatus TaxID=2056292 RepID=A0AAD5VBJ9_9APHY|nr:hypothetical protein NLI96_g1724 [Physisporinus lineatus]